MSGLSNSRHAPWRQPTASSRGSPAAPPPVAITPASTATHNHNHTHSRNGSNGVQSHSSLLAAYELNRYTKIVRRLKWKLPFLATAYHHAVDRVGRDPADVAEAELMFKLDFFEYYMLIERALVHLLGVFGIAISRGGPGGGDRYKSRNNSPGEGGGGEGEHRYHANVLEALDSPENPLHGALGTGEVRKQLSRAKDLRNRWKTAGDDSDDPRRSPLPGGRRARLAAPLETYDLERILTAIFAGFDAAFLVADRAVRGGQSNGSDVDMGYHAMDQAASEEEQWEFMVEAMDWEAV